MDQAPIPQHQLLDRLFDNMLIPVAYMDTRFNFIRVNQAYAEADDKDIEYFIGKNHFDIYPNQENEHIFSHVVETGKVHHATAKPFEYEYNPEREPTYWDWTLTPVKNDDQVAGVLLMLLDVTTHVTATGIAEHERKFCESILSAAGDLIVVLDKKGRIVRFNKACENLTGYSADEIIGTYIWEKLIGADEVEAVKSVFDELTISPAENRYENYWYAKDGTKCWIRWTNSNLTNNKGEVSYIVASGSNISDRKLADEENIQNRETLDSLINERTREYLKAKEEAEHANHLKSVFLGRLSHELRTPMNAILGFLQLLEIDRDKLPPESRNHITEIHDASQHLQELINEVLDMSNIEAGKVELDIQSLSVVELVNQCLALVRHLATSKQVKIVNEIDEQDNLHLLGDPVRLKEVLVNLLSNAIKYNKPGGDVHVTAEILDTDGNDQVRIGVRDTGKGITRQEQQLIFEPFARLGAEYTDIEGTGMGLAIARRLMELQGGSIGLESELGTGSLFYIDCPATIPTSAKSEVTDMGKDNNTPQSGMTFRILYVEDNPANVRLVETILDMIPSVELTSANNGIDGLETALQEDFDLILLDLNLPGMNGYEVLDKLRENVKTRETRTFAMSASVQPTDIEEGLVAGFNKYITKPFNVSEFLEIIRQEITDRYG